MLTLLAVGLAGLAAALGAGRWRPAPRAQLSRPTARVGLGASGLGQPGQGLSSPGPASPGPAGKPRIWQARIWQARLGCLLAGLGLVGLFGPAIGGLLAAGVVGLLPGRLLKLETTARRRERLRIARDAPVAAELLAAALEAGASLRDALLAVASALGGPVGQRLDLAAVLIGYGQSPAQAWAGASAGAGAALRPIGDASAAAQALGTALSAQLRDVAAEARSLRRGQLLESAHRVGVRSVAPLGLCFLPAFVLLGVVPVVAASLAHLAG